MMSIITVNCVSGHPYRIRSAFAESYELSEAVAAAKAAVKLPERILHASAYLTRIVKAREMDKAQAWMTLRSGERVSGPDIPKAFREHLQQCFIERPFSQNALDKLLKDIQAQPEAWIGFEAPFTPQEYRAIMKNLNVNSSPGVDGLTWKMFKALQSEWEEPLLAAYNSIWNGYSKVPEEWLEGIITPIYKGKGERDQAANWRPITLLPCVLKILTKRKSVYNK